jgi:hypothetical protein
VLSQKYLHFTENQKKTQTLLEKEAAGNQQDKILVSPSSFRNNMKVFSCLIKQLRDSGHFRRLGKVLLADSLTEIVDHKACVSRELERDKDEAAWLSDFSEVPLGLCFPLHSMLLRDPCLCPFVPFLCTI